MAVPYWICANLQARYANNEGLAVRGNLDTPRPVGKRSLREGRTQRAVGCDRVAVNVEVDCGGYKNRPAIRRNRQEIAIFDARVTGGVQSGIQCQGAVRLVYLEVRDVVRGRIIDI